MPANSLIVGVDLAPIKPVPRTITFQSDITTDKCRATIKQHLKTWKADTVLHDGAPNVGTAWVQDAFSQAELTLQSLKLATEFLTPGGTFVSKVFRSKDYNALLWVFGQLFDKVEATKPPSSRNVSAEIFVVCRGFKAPKRIDPNFLDPRAVFAEVIEAAVNNEARVFNPERKRRKREGYEEGDYTQFKETSASDFIQTADPISMLGSLNRFVFGEDANRDSVLAALNILPETTLEIRQCCKDLKVLGRKEFRSLLRWRLKAREKFGFSFKKGTAIHDADEVVTIAPMDVELQIQEELQRLSANESSRKKRDRRRENERKQKEIIRMQMHMLPPTELGLEQATLTGEGSMFALTAVDRAGITESISQSQLVGDLEYGRERTECETEGSDDIDDDDGGENDQLDQELDSMYEQYQERKAEANSKYRAKRARVEHEDDDWEGLSDQDQAASKSGNSSSDSSGNDKPNVGVRQLFPKYNQLNVGSNGLTRRASAFFDHGVFRDIENLDVESDNDSAIDMTVSSPHQHRSSKAQNTEAVQIKSHAIGALHPAIVAYNQDLQPISNNNLTHQGPRKFKSESGFEEVTEIETVQSFGNEWERQGDPSTQGRLSKSTDYLGA